MENNYSFQESTPEKLELTLSSCDFLRETVKGTKFLSIMGFVGVAIMVLLGLFMGVILSMMPSGNQTPLPFAPGLLSLFYLVFAAVYACPVYYLYKFSVDVKGALDSMDSNLLEDGLSYLKSHYKFVGIATIVVISLYILFFIGAFFIGISAAFMH